MIAHKEGPPVRGAPSDESTCRSSVSESAATTGRRCEYEPCGISLEGMRRDARFCGPAHRAAAWTRDHPRTPAEGVDNGFEEMREKARRAVQIAGALRVENDRLRAENGRVHEETFELGALIEHLEDRIRELEEQNVGAVR